MNRANKIWQKPEMIVLVRSNPEEMVLEPCKTSNGGGPSAGGNECADTGARCFGIRQS